MTREEARERARELVAKMTLEEKCSQLTLRRACHQTLGDSGVQLVE